MNNKFEKEIEVLNVFRKLYPHFPKGKLVKWESPDFLLKITPKKTIGIELTSIFSDFSFQEIKNTIYRKEDKISIYQKIKPFQLWLVIYGNFEPNIVSFADNITPVRSNFSKIFLINLSGYKLLMLK